MDGMEERSTLARGFGAMLAFLRRKPGRTRALRLPCLRAPRDGTAQKRRGVASLRDSKGALFLPGGKHTPGSESRKGQTLATASLAALSGSARNCTAAY